MPQGPTQKFGIKGLSHSYANLSVLMGVEFSLNPNEITCVLGPSGCGKTTLLRILAGVLVPSSGEVGAGFNESKSFLFQEPRLLPQLTAWENLMFTTRHRREHEKVQAEATALMDAVRLLKYKDYYPDELSGGMQQRLAIVRAFLQPSELMLMDEPFRSLDIEIMVSVIDSFKAIWAEKPKTVLMVTHDVLAAALLGDKIIVMSEKPSKVRTEMNNPVPRENRSIGEIGISTLQNTIYKKLCPQTAYDV